MARFLGQGTVNESAAADGPALGRLTNTEQENAKSLTVILIRFLDMYLWLVFGANQRFNAAFLFLSPIPPTANYNNCNVDRIHDNQTACFPSHKLIIP